MIFFEENRELTAFVEASAFIPQSRDFRLRARLRADKPARQDGVASRSVPMH